MYIYKKIIIIIILVILKRKGLQCCFFLQPYGLRIQPLHVIPHNKTIQGLDPTKLARTGFYVVEVAKDKAILQCQCCTTSISQWTTSDDEIMAHKSYAPWCPIITQQPSNNVPLDKNLLQQATDPIPPQYQPTTIEYIETTPEEEQHNRRRYQNHITRKASC